MKELLNKLKESKYIPIVIIVLIISLLLVGTYALMTWISSDNTELTTRIGNIASVYFDKGNDINVSNIGPVFNYETDGEATEFTVTNLITDDVVVSVNLNITSITDNLKEESFKYALLSKTGNNAYTLLEEGNFLNATSSSTINLVSNYMLTSSNNISYKLIIYIDGNMENPTTMQGGSLRGSISVDAGVPNSYIINPNCTNATATYDYIKKSILLSNVSSAGAISCSPTSTGTMRTYFSQKIISLLGTSTSVASEAKTGNGSTLEKINSTAPTGTSTDYRYRGIDPANYVMFNNELWRIIGVFDSNSHGIANTNLVKIIRNDSIGAYVWDNSQTRDDETTYYGTNNYPDSDIYNLLNKAYYNTTSVTEPPIDATGQDYCYAYQSSLTGKCNFTKIGIQPEYKRMVEDSVTWYLGGYSSISAKASAFYTYERTSTSKYTDNVATTTTTTPIGLMYVSDYGYAAPSACNDTGIGSFKSSNSTLGTTCAAQDWLKSNYCEWTITPRSSNSYYVFYLYVSGQLSDNQAYSGYATRPVLYLDSSVYYLSGTGTQIDPYIIAMD